MTRTGDKRIKRITAAALALTVIFLVAITTLCVVFPNKYAKRLNSAAAEFGLDRSLVRAVVYAESRFDARAVSSKGALGLMQLMPETLDECAAALGIAGADGFDPTTSLRCGCYYLSTLISRLKSTRAALLAYNAGEANAKRFMGGEEVFPETKRYVEKIFRAQRLYALFDKA